MEATLCNDCLSSKNHHEFKDAFARPSSDGKWYLSWTFFDSSDAAGCKAFICHTCGDRRNAYEFGVTNTEGNLVPAAACCTQTHTCKLAAEFWGKNDWGPINALDTFRRESRP